MLPEITQPRNWDMKLKRRAWPGPACLAPPWASPTLQECEAGIPSLVWAALNKLEGRGRGHHAGTAPPRQIRTGVGTPAQPTQLLPSPAPQARALSPPWANPCNWKHLHPLAETSLGAQRAQSPWAASEAAVVAVSKRASRGGAQEGTQAMCACGSFPMSLWA